MRIESTSITNANAGELLLQATAAIARGDFAVDLSAVREVDTAAVALLMEWQRRAQAAGRRLALSGVPADVASLAELYGVAGLLGLDGQGSWTSGAGPEADGSASAGASTIRQPPS